MSEGRTLGQSLFMAEHNKRFEKKAAPMTDPQIKPVTAWAVVDKKGKLTLWFRYNLDEAIDDKNVRDIVWRDRAPHRVIEVTITPKEKG